MKDTHKLRIDYRYTSEMQVYVIVKIRKIQINCNLYHITQQWMKSIKNLKLIVVVSTWYVGDKK
jgi:hypothetical protein